MIQNKFIRQSIEELDRGKINKVDIQELKEMLLELDDEKEQKDLEEFLSWYQNYINQDFLINLIDKNNLEEIFILSFDNVFIKYIDQSKERIKIPLDQKYFENFVSALLIKAEKELNLSNPFASFNLRIKNIELRITIIHSSTGPHALSKIYIRKISENVLELDQFITDQEVASKIIELIKQKRNIIICGGTGSGKTTFLSSLLKYLDPMENVVVIEDTQEILVSNTLQTRFISKQKEKFDLKDYVTYSLRMSPDRIILGEIRSEEVIPYVLSGNNGHKGLMSTIHANSANLAIERLGILFSIFSRNSHIKFSHVLKMLATSIDYVVHMKNKKINQIIQVYGHNGDQLIFENIYQRESLR